MDPPKEGIPKGTAAGAKAVGRFPGAVMF